MYKRIGILGGMTPESTVSYYQHIFRHYEELFGDLGYPETVIYDVSFQRFVDWMGKEDWGSIENALVNGLERLAAAGVDFAVIATNTMHLLFEKLEARSPVPLISIVDATAEAIEEQGMRVVGLLGTRFTMEKPFYREGLKRHGIETLIPDKEDRDYIDRVVFNELSKGILLPESRKGYLEIIDRMVEQGAQGIVLGCTEIPLLVTQKHTNVKLFDTAIIHAEKALQHAIGT
ncbi:MAG: amino acid racemase [Candidatus Bathyarchaeota archaeon]|jgi:aspartate racemase